MVVGAIGFAAPGFLGAHLGAVHNAVHLVTGAISFRLGVKGTRVAARAFCLAFGVVYGLLGVLGFALGVPGYGGAGHGGTDDRLWRAIPGRLELGTVDHVIHMVLGLAFVVAGLATRVVKAPLAGAEPSGR